jgi:drug/metabolite transporter (DMT)-like permease
MNLSATRLAHSAMLLFTALVATSFTTGGLIAKTIAPEALTALRCLIAAVIFAAVAWTMGALRIPGLADCGRYAIIGFVLAVFFVTMFEALRWADPLSAGAVFTLLPVMTALMGWAINRERPRLTASLALAAGALAALWVLFDADLERLSRFSIGKGELIFLFGCLAYAAYAPLVKRFHHGEPLVLMNLWALIFALVFVVLYGASSIIETDWRAMPFTTYAGIAYLAVFTTALTFFLVKSASLVLPGFKVMAYTYLLPSFVALYEGILGHGWPPSSVTAGILVSALTVLSIAKARS